MSISAKLRRALKPYLSKPVRDRLNWLELDLQSSWKRAQTYFERDIRVEDVGGSTTCIICSGMLFDWRYRGFEYARTMDKLSINRIYLRDSRQRWYQGGIRGVPGGLEGLCTEVRRQVDALGVPAFSMGGSMGGYAALILAARLQLAGALVFAPQVFIDTETRERNGDHRWEPLLRRMRKHHPQPLSVRDELLKHPVPGPIELWLGTSETRDRPHADLIADMPDVRIHEIEAQHTVSRTLRDDGRLPGVIAEFVEGLRVADRV